MFKIFPRLVLVAACVLAAPLMAQTPVNAPLYVALGEKPGIAKLMGELIDRASTDPRIDQTFKGIKLPYLKEQLTDQICLLSGGPCVYDGETMKNSHADLKLEKKHFNALVEVLQDTMDAQGVPFPVQRQLLAILAPMHRDVITVR